MRPGLTSVLSLLLAAAVLSACGQVGTQVTNPGPSDPATVAPSIATQPASQSITAGQSATFAVAATGTEPLAYQWDKNGTPIGNATASSYTTPAETTADDGAKFAVTVSNSAGNAVSAAATLRVSAAGGGSVAPAIATQPADQSVTAGAPATFTVVAAGTAPLSYQWQKNGTAISGANAASYTTPAETTTDNGAVFVVVVSNTAGSIASRSAVLTVLDAHPAITAQPLDQSITAGQTASFTVVATGTAPLSYQWQKNGTAIGGANAATYTTPAETTADNGATFAVVVSNPAGSAVSRAATLNVSAGGGPVAPSITSQPANQTISAGQAATFTVVATGTAPLSYQWEKNDTPISGASAASYTTPAESTTDNGATFEVRVSNSAGSVTSRAAVLTVNAVKPAITTQPADATISAGQTATFTVVATGTAPLSYQWQKNGSAISGATAARYTTPAETTADNGATFVVVVSNSAGSIASRSALLTVNAAKPQITTQPTGQTIRAGQSATFSVVATGTAPLSYQWQKNGTAIPGATTSSYTTPTETTADNGAVFAVVVSNAAGSTPSSNAVLTVTSSTSAGTDVVTYKNDLARTGQNLTETTLTLANVSPSTFGKLRFLATDGLVDAQPLYLSGLSIGSASHNVVFIATEHDTAYAFDSDTGTVLWQKSLLGSGESPSDDHSCSQVTPTIGVTSTPVIDRSAGAHGIIYLVAMSRDSGGSYHQRLHALDVTTGAELLGGPTEIAAVYPANGGGFNTFDAGDYAERAALLLLNGVIYTTWTSHCDVAPYSGWVIAYSATTLAQSAVLNVAPNGLGGGPSIWMAGGGPAADASGNIYVLTANGVFETTLLNGFPKLGDYGNSFLRISTAGGGLTVADYFTMFNEVSESAGDVDLGSGGVMLLPDVTDSGGTTRHLTVGAGKDGNLYVVNRDSMGKFSAATNNIWQELNGALNGGIWSTPAYFNGSVYYGPNGATLRAFPLADARLGSPTSQSSNGFPYPGTAPAVSANGAANGIVWAYENASSGAAVLHAYEASNLAHELYNSTMAAGSRDAFGSGNKFITPTIADGKVFAATTSGVAVFGLLP